MKISLSIRQNFKSPELIFKRAELIKVIKTTLQHLALQENYELGLACVDNQESQQLNHTYRGKDKPTNVLSFLAEIPEEVLPMLDTRPLGDLVICIPVVLQEAQAQQKTVLSHFYHLLVHGVLHLLGYDHELGEQEAEEMEQLEIDILAKLGIKNPYLSQDT